MSGRSASGRAAPGPAAVALVGDGETSTARLRHTCAGCSGAIEPGSQQVVVRFRGGLWDRRHPGCGTAATESRLPLQVVPGGGLALQE